MNSLAIAAPASVPPSPSSGFAASEQRASTSGIRRVGVVGIGRMGEAYAQNLIADGYQVTVYNRGPGRTATLASAEAEVASDLRDLAPCEVVLTALPDDAAVTEVALEAGGLIHVLAPGAIHVSMSTVSPPLSRHLARRTILCGGTGARQSRSRACTEALRDGCRRGTSGDDRFAATRTPRPASFRAGRGCWCG